MIRKLGLALALAAFWYGPISAAQQTPVPAAPDSLARQVERLIEQVGRLTVAVDGLSTADTDTTVAPVERSATATVGEALDSATSEVRTLGLRSVVAVFLLVLTSVVVRAVTWILGHLAERSPRRRLLFKRIDPILRIALWALTAVLIVRGVFDVDGSTLLTAGAAVGVAIGFAAQDIVKNVFGGLVIIGDRPFQVGDKISVGGTYGEVTSIGLRSTRIVTPDDNLVTVPNAQVMAGQVSNANAGALDCQVVTDLYLPGWVDISQAKDIAYRAAMTSRFVYTGKPVVVLAKDEMHETFVTHLKVKAYVLDIRFEFAFMSDVTERARAGFREAGVLPPWHGAYPLVTLPDARPVTSG